MNRHLLSLGAVTLSMVFAVSVGPEAGQSGAPVARGAATARPYVAPKTPWGDPDIQGGYSNKDENGIPFERPGNLSGKQLGEFVDSELAELASARDAGRLEAARGIGMTGAKAVKNLEEMEAGAREPSRRQVVDMAKRYRRPLLTFYLSDPPGPGPRTHDFRTLPEQRKESESLVSALIRDVKARQAIVAGALEEAQEAEVLPFVGSMSLKDGPDRLAAAMLAIRHLIFDTILVQC